MTAWIRQGAQRHKTIAEKPAWELAVTPRGLHFANANLENSIEVRSRRNGSPDEVATCFCRFESYDDRIAVVTPDGIVRAVQPGMTHITVSCGNERRTIPIVVSFPKAVGTTAPS